MAQDQKKWDPVTVIGIVVAIVLFGVFLMYQNKQQAEYLEKLRDWKEQQAQREENERKQREAELAKTPLPAQKDAPALTGTETQPPIGDEPKAQPAAQNAETQNPELPLLVVTSDDLTLTFGSRGGTLHKASLNAYKPMARSTQTGLEILDEINRGILTLGLPAFQFGDEIHTQLDQKHWALIEDSKRFDVQGNYKLAFALTLGRQGENGWEPVCKVIRRFGIPKQSRSIEVELQVENLSRSAQTFEYRVRGPAGILLDGPPENPKQDAYIAIRCLMAGRKAGETPDVYSFVFDSAKAALERDRMVSAQQNVWMGLSNRFFIAMLINRKPEKISKMVVEPLHDDSTRIRPLNDLRFVEPNMTMYGYRIIDRDNNGNPLKLDPGSTSAGDAYALYLGPLEEKILEAEETKLGLTNYNLSYAVKYCTIFDWNWPTIDWIARKLIWVFNAIEGLVGSLGIAVIFLTILIKLALHPMQRKMTVSMIRMQQLQPELQKIEKKYEGQTAPEIRQKKELEKLDLMRRSGANPAMGCLPMFFQMPIFFALYGVFAHAFSIRQASFLWIDDLALADRFLQFGIYPYELNLLPILYVGLTLYTTLKQPKPKNPDPQQEMQRKMMLWMPAIFGIVLYKMPAGLIIYFAASACFGLVESWYVKKFVIGVDKDGNPPPLDLPGKDGKPAIPAAVGKKG